MSKRRSNGRPRERMAVILFVDIINSSELSNVLSFTQYDRFVRTFQSVTTEVLSKYLICDERYAKDRRRQFEASVRGDEVCVILYSNVGGAKVADYRREDIKMALLLAIEMKRKWLTSEPNSRRIKDGKSLVDIGIGINCGHVVVGEHCRISPENEVQKRTTAEGYAINLAKRIEVHSRGGVYSKIFVSRSVYTILRIDFQIAFAGVQMACFEGSAQPVPVYEIKSFGHVEDTAFAPLLNANDVTSYERAVAHNPHELWLVLDLAHHRFDSEEYSEAAEKYRLAIEIDPEFAPAHMYLGRSYYRDFQDDQAVAHLERARELNPDSARANNFLGVCLRRLAYRTKYPKTTSERGASTRVQGYYQRALDYHKTAMRIAEEKPVRYRWAFNAYGMTLAQAIQEDAWPATDLEKKQSLREAMAKVDAVLRLKPESQHNLFHHVRGLILAVQGRLDNAEEEFSSAVVFLREDKGVSPKKYREKMGEICFHRGLFLPRTAHYRQAICQAYAGDLFRPHGGRSIGSRERSSRREFLKRQYWFNRARSDLLEEGTTIESILSSCWKCLKTGKTCYPDSKGCIALRKKGKKKTRTSASSSAPSATRSE